MNATPTNLQDAQSQSRIQPNLNYVAYFDLKGNVRAKLFKYRCSDIFTDVAARSNFEPTAVERRGSFPRIHINLRLLDRPNL